MKYLVIGAASSGKSEYAEDLMVSHAGAAGGELIYLATMRRCEAARERIARHIKKREGKGFRTIEREVDFDGLKLPQEAFVLVEDVPNLVVNEFFRRCGDGAEAEAKKRLFSAVDHLVDSCDNICFVTGECLSGGDIYEEATDRYMRVLGELQCYIAFSCDTVIEVVSGVPVAIKGDLPGGT